MLPDPVSYLLGYGGVVLTAQAGNGVVPAGDGAVCFVGVCVYEYGWGGAVGGGFGEGGAVKDSSICLYDEAYVATKV